MNSETTKSGCLVDVFSLCCASKEIQACVSCYLSWHVLSVCPDPFGCVLEGCQWLRRDEWMLCRSCLLSPGAAHPCMAQLPVAVLHLWGVSCSACPPASLLSFPSSQEPIPAAESALEEAGVTEVAVMRRQVRWG